MIVLVTGGRDYNNIEVVFDAIAALHAHTEIEYIVHGDAKGADSLADEVAKEIGINRVKFPANWTKHKRSAGPIRNRIMIELVQIDVVLAFPGGEGTADMKHQAQKNGIPVIDAIDLLQD